MVYTVGEMAKIIGVPASTLRYYDQEGLLPFVERSGGGMRIFSEKDYETLLVIECLKRSGLSIREIKDFIHMALEGDASIGRRLELFRNRREELKKQMSAMAETLEILNYKCWYYETAAKAGTEAAVRDMDISEVPPELRGAREKLSHI